MRLEILLNGAGGVYTTRPMSCEIVPGEDIYVFTRNGKRIKLDVENITADRNYRMLVKLDKGDEIVRVSSIASFETHQSG